jgi:hypothetical protein
VVDTVKKSSKKIEAAAARLDGLRPAGSDGAVSKLPDGNHGDNLQTTRKASFRIATEELIAAGLDLALSYGIKTAQSVAFMRALRRFNRAKALV